MKHRNLGFVLASALTAVAIGCAKDAEPIDPKLAASPTACREGIATYRENEIEAAKEVKVALNNDSLRAGMAAFAQRCVTYFDVDTLPLEMLPDMGALYVGAGDVKGARKAFARIIDNKELSDSARADAAALAVETMRKAHVADSGIVWAEPYISVVDGFSNVPTQQFKARAAVIAFYLGRDIDDKLEPTAQQMYELAAQMPAADQKELTKEISKSITVIAAQHASNLRSDSAVAILKIAPSRFPTIQEELTEAVEPALLRYQLIGKKVPALLADYWLGNEVKVPSGTPTLVMFTANWCPSCKKSYSSIKEFDSLYAPNGLKTVLAVTLDGVFEGLDMEPADEVKANEKYFRETEKLTFPIAVQNNEDAAGEDAVIRNAKSYQVGGFPQFMVIDKSGVVRAIILGWDPYGNRKKALAASLQSIM